MSQETEAIEADVLMGQGPVATGTSGLPAIRVHNLSKCYRIYDKPMHRLFQGMVGDTRKFYREFWALKNISFEVGVGETFAIIGRNGSGKSTLLQLIAETLSVTEGEILKTGRVAALLELGSGFNPEFSGRENVYLNASILGLSRREVDERFEAISAFADIGDFIDQPVRNYSSGMVMRLAFSVMVHVDADILVIDEALAVGDAFFNQKCMRFLQEFKQSGTLLFVSHDVSAVTALCDRAIWLDNGQILQSGDAKDVANAYLDACLLEKMGPAEARRANAAFAEQFPVRRIDPRRELLDRSTLRNDIEVFPFNPDATGLGQLKARVLDVALIGATGDALAWVLGGEIVTLEIVALSEAALSAAIVGFYIRNKTGQLLFGDNTHLMYREQPLEVAEGGIFRARFRFEMPRLQQGQYFVTVCIAEGTQDAHVVQQWIHEALMFQSHSVGGQFGLIGIPMTDIELMSG